MRQDASRVGEPSTFRTKQTRPAFGIRSDMDDLQGDYYPGGEGEIDNDAQALVMVVSQILLKGRANPLDLSAEDAWKVYVDTWTAATKANGTKEDSQWESTVTMDSPLARRFMAEWRGQQAARSEMGKLVLPRMFPERY